jgi:hypothetical protein
VFDASPIQPILAGLVTFTGGVWVFSGKGVGPVGVGHIGAGIFALPFDAGLIGNAGAVQPIPVQVPGFPADPTPDPDVRSVVTLRGPFPTGIFNIATRYVFASAAVGAVSVEVVFANASNVLTDPPAGGFDIIVWKGLGGDRAGPQLIS